nr:putative alanyl-tRNA editing protein alaX [Ipomoea batatas]
MEQNLPPTKLEYYDNMSKLHSTATLLSSFRVFHYGFFENSGDGVSNLKLEKGAEVSLSVDEQRRMLNTRLHSAGHLLDVCIANIGWGHLKPGKAYHFPDGPFVEYQGTVPQNELQIKQKELEAEANNLISKGEKVCFFLLIF